MIVEFLKRSVRLIKPELTYVVSLYNISVSFMKKSLGNFISTIIEKGMHIHHFRKFMSLLKIDLSVQRWTYSSWPVWSLVKLVCYYISRIAYSVTGLKTVLSRWIVLWSVTTMSANLLSLNQSKTEFLLIGLPGQLCKVSDPSLLMPSNITIILAKSARNLGVIFDSTLSMYDHISSVSKSCFLSFHDLRRIRNTLDFSTARTIATSLIHAKLDYCNSLFLNLPQSQLGHLQLILNSSARDVSKTPKFVHITP